LQKSSGDGCGTICFLAQRTSDGEKIVASDNNRRARNVSAVHRVRMITNVDHGWPFCEPGPELTREDDELVDVAEPFRDEATGTPKSSEERPSGNHPPAHP